MSLNSALIKLASLVYKRELDPRRAERVYREYDDARGYADYHRRCQAQFARARPAHSESALRQRGFEYLNVLEPARAAAILERLETEHGLSLLKKDSRDLEGFRVAPEFIVETLDAVLTPAVDDKLAGFFGSEYLVHWVTYSMAPRAPEQASVSFRWHCDRGPRAHLKLIVYLNPTADHGGNTEFIELADTARIGQRGYLFGWTKTRTGEVDHLARIAGTEIRAHQRAMGAGDGVVFQPATVLHRGLSPTLGPRYVITLCLLPSPLPWREAFERGTLSDLAQDDKWHRHAHDLSNTLAR